MLGLGVVRTATPSTVVRNRIEDESKSNGVPLSLSFSKPSWVVRTEASCAYLFCFSQKKKRRIILFIHRAMKKRKNWVFVRLIGFGFGLQSNVRKLARKKPDPSCGVCHGTGRVDCYNCSGEGKFLLDF